MTHKVRKNAALPLLLTLLLVTGLTGCATAPQRDKVVPTLAVPASFEAAGESASEPASEELQSEPFWKTFGDPDLEALVGEALAGNDDLRLAAARVAEAQALLGNARADLYPEIGAGLGASRSDPGVDSPPDMGLPSNKLILQATVAYEVDLWGRVRRQRDAAGQRAAASRYDEEAARLSVAGAVSRAWLGHRVTATQLAAARRTLESRREALELQSLRAEAGVVDELQLQQAKAERAAAEAATQTLELAYQQERHALAVLLGKDPAELGGASLPLPKELPLVPVVPAYLPSQLLARRPDVRAGEARLMAAAGDVAAARTAFLPSLNLTGNLGSETRTLGALFDPGTSVWTIAADLVQAVFSGGRYRAGIALKEAQQEQVLIAYRQSVRGAFREVLDALVAQRRLRDAIAARQEELVARQKALELAKLRYDAGYVAYLEVLDAQRNLFTSEQDKLTLERSALENAVNLMLALGGGWQESAKV